MIVLGLFKEIYNNADYPSIKSYLDKPTEHKEAILNYMRKSNISSAAPSITKDIFNGEPIKLPLCCMNDGHYAWRSDLIYYIEKYNLQLPDDFIQHVLNTT